MKFKEIYLKITDRAIARQVSDGAMPSGHNGHYNDPETPVRNTSHYLIVFLKAWELSSEEKYKDAALKCLNFLLSDRNYCSSYTFQHRVKAGKDQCNGLIGPAWNIEALLFAADRLQRPEARSLARKLFLLHPFDLASASWKRVEPDGTILSIDPTFNHQLWFASCAAPLAFDSPVVAERISQFLIQLNDNWKILKNGRIIHPLWVKSRRNRERLKRILQPSYRKKMIAKEIGYQGFNLYALSMLLQSGIEIPDFIRERSSRALGYIESMEYLNGIKNNICGFPYNPPGWEVSLGKIVIGKQPTSNCLTWLQRQITHSYDVQNSLLSLNTSDVETQTARIYETARLPATFFELEIEV